MNLLILYYNDLITICYALWYEWFIPSKRINTTLHLWSFVLVAFFFSNNQNTGKSYNTFSQLSQMEGKNECKLFSVLFTNISQMLSTDLTRYVGLMEWAGCAVWARIFKCQDGGLGSVLISQRVKMSTRFPFCV